MKTVIYYFSGTGNSLKVAKDIAAGLGDATLVPIRKAITGPVTLNADRIGLVFPVYVWGPPVIVANFFKKLPASNAYVFAVTTCGGFAAGTLPLAQKMLAQQGIKLSAGFVVRMPGNYTPLYGAQSQERQQKMFDAARKKVAEIVALVKEKKEAPVEKNNVLMNTLFTSLIYSKGIAGMHEADKKFWAQDSCTSCGICEKVCPVGNITLENGRPVWHQRCEQCLACLQWCPVEAIQFAKSTQGRSRYRHPEAKAEDFYTV